MRRLKRKVLPIICLSLLVACSVGENKGQSTNQDEKVTKDMEGKTDTATLGAGCFWCVEAVFQEVEGVISVKSGYAGGFVKNPTYKEVCTGKTGHAEVAQLIYDSSKVSFEELLEIFWKTHDPTTLNRQGNDVGTQYRSAVFYHNQDQKEKAEFYKKRINDSGAYPSNIVTTIEPFENYSEAEENHQNYFSDNASQPYCTYVIQPKVEKFRKAFADKLKK